MLPYSTDTLYTFTDGLFDQECPPATTPTDNTGVLPCSQTPLEEYIHLEGVASMAPPSEPQQCSSELQSGSSRLRNSPSPLQNSSCDQLQCVMVSGPPSPPSTLHLAEDPLPTRRKRAASVNGCSVAKKSRSDTSIDKICQLLAKRCAKVTYMYVHNICRRAHPQ